MLTKIIPRPFGDHSEPTQQKIQLFVLAPTRPYLVRPKSLFLPVHVRPAGWISAPLGDRQLEKLPGNAVESPFRTTRCQISHKTMFSKVPFWARLAWLALACFASLASDRPRSPCLHLATTAEPPSAAPHRCCCCEAQARRARPIRGALSQASQGQPRRQPMCFEVNNFFVFFEKTYPEKSDIPHLHYSTFVNHV